jgi:hypothetical protein
LLILVLNVNVKIYSNSIVHRGSYIHLTSHQKSLNACLNDRFSK